MSKKLSAPRSKPRSNNAKNYSPELWTGDLSEQFATLNQIKRFLCLG